MTDSVQSELQSIAVRFPSNFFADKSRFVFVAPGVASVQITLEERSIKWVYTQRCGFQDLFEEDFDIRRQDDWLVFTYGNYHKGAVLVLEMALFAFGGKRVDAQGVLLPGEHLKEFLAHNDHVLKQWATVSHCFFTFWAQLEELVEDHSKAISHYDLDLV